jgi:hypothetical protein
MAAVALQAGALEPLRKHCSIGPSEEPGKFSLRIGDADCGGNRHCGSSFSSESFSRFTGLSMSDLSREGAQLTATLKAEAGTFTCSGTVQAGKLTGESVFTPDAGFVERMGRMGFSFYDSEKLLAYAFLGVDSEYARSLQQAGIRGITTDNLIALHIFKVDSEYAQSMTSLGYELPDADQLGALRVQKVDAAEVREIRAMGYKPTLDELIQCRIFKITPEFIRSMQARGMKDLTIAKLVQIKIFKLDE